MDNVLDVIDDLLNKYRFKKVNSVTREYYIYYAGAVDGLSALRKKLTS